MAGLEESEVLTPEQQELVKQIVDQTSAKDRKAFNSGWWKFVIPVCLTIAVQFVYFIDSYSTLKAEQIHVKDATKHNTEHVEKLSGAVLKNSEAIKVLIEGQKEMQILQKEMIKEQQKLRIDFEKFKAKNGGD